MTSFELKPSFLWQRLLIALHTAVAALLIYSTLPVFYTVAALGLCIASFVLAERSRRRQGQFRNLLFDTAGFYLLTADNKRMSAQLNGELLSTPFLIILQMIAENPDDTLRSQKISLVFFCDALAKEDWRKLRVLLRTLPSAALKQ